MNAVTDAVAAPTTAVDIRDDDSASPYTLRRTGRRAVRFEGCHLLEAMGPTEGRQVWHDLNLYRTRAGSIVVELIVRRSVPDRNDTARVETFADLQAAAAWLEAYCPADDATIPAGLGAADTPLPWAVLQAVQLRQRVERIEMDYRALLSDVFAAMDITDPAGA
jgi:hypothetical protein